MTEDDIQDTIGDSILMCFAGWMQVWEKRSQYSDKLLELVTKEVTRRVNHSLAANILSPSHAQFDICQILLCEMVFHTSKILYRCFWRAKRIDLDGDDFDFSSTEDDEPTPEFSSPNDVVEFNTEDVESDCSSSDSVVPSFHVIEDSPSLAVKETKRAHTFEKNVRRFFKRRSTKVTPASEVVQNGSTLLHPKKQHAITSMFSALAKILRKLFTCYAND